MMGVLAFAFRQAEAFLGDGFFLVGRGVGGADRGGKAAGEGEAEQTMHGSILRRFPT